MTADSALALPLVTTRGDGMTRVETNYFRLSDNYVTGVLGELGDWPFLKTHMFEYSRTEADARTAHAAMVDRLDAALLARIARVSPDEGQRNE